MMEKKKMIRNLVLLAILLVFALWFALHKDLKGVLVLLQNMNPAWGVAVVVFGLLFYVLAGVHLTWIAKDYRQEYRYRDGILCAFSCALFNGITPLGCGQVAQTYVLRKQRFSMRNSLSILMMDFIIFQCVILLFAFVFILWGVFTSFTTYEPWLLLILAGFGVNLFVIMVLWTMAFFSLLYQRVFDQVIKLGHRLHIVKNMEETKQHWDEQITLFQEQMVKLRKERVLMYKLVGLQVVRMLLYYSLPIFSALALHLPIEAKDVLAFMAMSSYLHMLNALTPLPGDTGWSETVFIMMFAIFYPWSSASALMLIWRFSSYHMVLLIGAVMFIVWKQRLQVDETKHQMQCHEIEDVCI